MPSKTMRAALARAFRVWLLLLPAMGLFMGQAGAAQPCEIKQLASLSMLDDTASIAVQAEINGRPQKLLVDTGAFATALSTEAASALGLKPHYAGGGGQYFNIKGEEFSDAVSGVTLQVGSIVAKDNELMVLPPGFHHGLADGILGSNFLQQFDVEFDFAARKINLFSPDHCPGGGVYWTDDSVDIPTTLNKGHIELPVQLEGKRVTAVLDTGATNTVLMMKTAQRVFGLERDQASTERPSDAVERGLIQSRYRFESLSVEGLTITNPKIFIARDYMTRAGAQPIELLLGLSELRRLRIYIAYRERLIHVSRADAH